jgi:hypothetical protein
MNEGVIIERTAGVESNAMTWLAQPSEGGCEAPQGCIWYLVQTNNDRSLPNYEQKDPRRFQGEAKIDALRFGTNLEGVKESVL